MPSLIQIRQEVQGRVGEIEAAHPNWPCHKGCDDCCRSLAREPEVSQSEWLGIQSALSALSTDAAQSALNRMGQNQHATRPVVCPLLDSASGTCLIYEARPIACRTYGYYAERDKVLGCFRIEALSRDSVDVIWGNHYAMEERLDQLGTRQPLSVWLTNGVTNSTS